MIYWKYLLTFISSWASLNRLPATWWVLTATRLTNYTKYIITDPLTNTLYQPVIDKSYILLSCVTSADVKFTLTMNYCFYQKWSVNLDRACWNNRVKILLVIISRGLKFSWSRASSSFKKAPESKRNKAWVSSRRFTRPPGQNVFTCDETLLLESLKAFILVVCQERFKQPAVFGV